MQQDAEECWGQIMLSLNSCFGFKYSGDDLVKDNSFKFVDQLFNIEFTSEFTCDAVASESAVSVETGNKLAVNIGAGVSTYLVSEIHNVFTPYFRIRKTYTHKQSLCFINLRFTFIASNLKEN